MEEEQEEEVRAAQRENPERWSVLTTRVALETAVREGAGWEREGGGETGERACKGPPLPANRERTHGTHGPGAEKVESPPQEDGGWRGGKGGKIACFVRRVRRAESL